MQEPLSNREKLAIERCRQMLLNQMFLDLLPTEMATELTPYVQVDLEAKILRISCLSFHHAMDVHRKTYASLLKGMTENRSLYNLCESVCWEYSYGAEGLLYPLRYFEVSQSR
jgi:hypothetical protein